MVVEGRENGDILCPLLCQLDQGRTRSRIPNGRVAILSHDGDVILTPRAGISSEHELADKYWRNSIDVSAEISWWHLKKSEEIHGQYERRSLFQISHKIHGRVSAPCLPRLSVLRRAELYTIHCTLYTVHSILYTVHYTLYVVYCILYTVHCTLYTVHYILYCILYTVKFTGQNCSAQST